MNMSWIGRNKEIYEKWVNIQDLIGDAVQWPRRIRRLFWTQNLKHFDRILVTAFCYVNGLTPEVFFEWACLLSLGRDTEAQRHFTALFRLFEQGRYSRSLYAWNTTNRRYEYLDGTVKQYVHASLRH
jgi:hypothetical protein